MKAFLSLTSTQRYPLDRANAAWTPEVVTLSGGKPTCEFAALLEAQKILAETEPATLQAHKMTCNPTTCSWPSAPVALAEALQAFLSQEVS